MSANSRLAAPQLPVPDAVVDASGKFCPVPILEAAKAVRRAQSGQVVEVVATDPGIESDMPAWCKATRNEYLGVVREGERYRAFVRKA